MDPALTTSAPAKTVIMVNTARFSSRIALWRPFLAADNSEELAIKKLNAANVLKATQASTVGIHNLTATERARTVMNLMVLVIKPRDCVNAIQAIWVILVNTEASIAIPRKSMIL